MRILCHRGSAEVKTEETSVQSLLVGPIQEIADESSSFSMQAMISANRLNVRFVH